MKTFLRASAAIALSIAIAGCGGTSQSPSGQVVAKVNGQEITLSELNAEMLANNLGNKSEDPAVRQATIQRLVARKLLVAVKDAGALST